METDFAAVGRLLGNPARSTMVSALLNGVALTATELAKTAGVSASTASEHLAMLVDGELAVVVSSGRHRYYQLASADVAQALEALSLISPSTPTRSLRQSMDNRALAIARTCYDHLAGDLGVALHDRLLANGWLDPCVGGYAVTDAGRDGLAKVGVDVGAVATQRRRFAYPCLDWTARRHHLAGGLAAAVTTQMLDRRWIRRTNGDRALRLTPEGEHQLNLLGVTA